ncbi:hypothetical protein HNP40_003006 [Mycobacteroides chelonae]|nr:hypothetical protein [Mycobacteroides chelonae]
MSLTPGELKKVSVQSIRDIAAGLRAKATSMRATKAGVTDLPHKGTWTGVAADNADHEIGHFATGVGRDADAYEDAARKVDRAGDEFEGLKQLLTKLENEAAGKFSINEATGEVTPLSKDFNKSDRDYIANTIKQLCAAGGQANDDLAAGIHATDASGTTTPAGATGALPTVPGSAIKPDGSMGALQNLAAPRPDGDPGATKAAAAGTDTQANYKEWYPKTTVPGSDKPVDPRLLGGLEAAPGVRDGRDQIPQRMSPTLQARDVPAFKETTRALLQKQGVPADQIEAKVNAAVERAQTPHFLPDAPSATPSEHVSRDFGEQFNKFTNGISDSASRTVDGQIDQAKVLTGQAGPGAPGVAEAWKDLAVDTGKGLINQAHELMTDPLAAPKMGIEEARDFVNSPSEYIGKNIIHGTEALATGAVGGEAAAGARGLLGDLTGAEGHALTHGIDDAAPGYHQPPVGEHHAPTVGDHSAPSAGDHSWDFAVDSNGHYVPGSLPSYEQLRDLTQTDPNTAHFWSGRDAGGIGVGPDGSGIAERIAEGVGGGTLETTLVKNGVDPLPVWNRHDPASVQFWEDASRAYAENTNGEVTAVIGSDLRPGNIWQTVEIPRLMENPGVTKIVQIDPDTGKSTVIFSRDK